MSFNNVFIQLREILNDYSADLVKTKDTDDEFLFDTHHIMKNQKPLFFGGVKIGKSYVSYHLMPVYVYPVLLDDISVELQNRMQGKSCFNFKEIDDSLFSELRKLTKRGYEKYQEAGFINTQA